MAVISGRKYTPYRFFSQPDPLLDNSTDFGLTRHEDDVRLRLEAWRRNVGAHVALDLLPNPSHDSSCAESGGAELERLDRPGPLAKLVSRIRNGDYAELGADPDCLWWCSRRKPTAATPPFPRYRRGRRAGCWSPGSEQQEDVVETARAPRYEPALRALDAKRCHPERSGQRDPFHPAAV